MPGAGYPLPPQEPPGGWKNIAHYVANMEYWVETMLKMGFGLEEAFNIGGLRIGGPLWNDFKAKNWLFPGADKAYEYDLDHHMKKLRQYTSNGETKGPGEWIPMDPSEIRDLNQYFGFRNDPGNEWKINATRSPGDNDPEGNPYVAWLRNWGDYYRSGDFKPPDEATWTMPTTNPFTGAVLKGGGPSSGGGSGGNLPGGGKGNIPPGPGKTPAPNSGYVPPGPSKGPGDIFQDTDPNAPRRLGGTSSAASLRGFGLDSPANIPSGANLPTPTPGNTLSGSGWNYTQAPQAGMTGFRRRMSNVRGTNVPNSRTGTGLDWWSRGSY